MMQAKPMRPLRRPRYISRRRRAGTRRTRSGLLVLVNERIRHGSTVEEIVARIGIAEGKTR